MRWISFPAPMISAIREGQKKQTRRVVKGLTETDEPDNLGDGESLWDGEKVITCPYGRPGDHLQVLDSRIALEIVSVRVERLQEISRAEAQADGVICRHCKGYSDNECGCTCINLYRNLWNSTIGKRHPWDSNPWVWVIGFKVVP